MTAKKSKKLKELIKQANEELLNPDHPNWTKNSNRILKALGLKVRLTSQKAR